ncbi:MAG: YabP/YqfC family sporulation protein [Clostridia bacterium]|nr:YabP/YqfC family sporulation protein [Clostridia bacterium]
MIKRKKIRPGSGAFSDVIKSACRDVFSDDMIEIHYDRLALITGCRKIKEYSKSRISLQFDKRRAVIEGIGLVPESLVNGQMAVSGIIQKVVFEDDQTCS